MCIRDRDLSKILSDDEVWELLLFSGYLTVEEKINQDNYISVSYTHLYKEI